MFMKKKLIIVVCSILFCIILLVSVVLIESLKTIEIRDINLTYNRDNYLKTKSYKGELLVFPRTIDNIAAINDYYYIDYQSRGSSVIVLDATYDEIGFDNEMNRLEHLVVRNWLYSEEKPSDYGKYKKLLYCEDNALFHLPTFVAVYNDSCEYEYVCVDYDNKRCIYVFIDSLSFEKIILDEKYIPINYQINISREGNDGNRYNVYPRYPDVKYDEWYTNKNDLS